MQRAIFLLIALMAVTTAQAQVIRCTNPKTGEVTYSDKSCDNNHSSSLVERRKSREQIMAERLQAAEANEQKYRNRLVEMEVEQQARQQAPVAAQQPLPDKSTSYECRLAQKNHETTSSSITGTTEEHRNRINASIMKVNAACGMKTELMQEPARPVIINNTSENFNGSCRRVGASLFCN